MSIPIKTFKNTHKTHQKTTKNLITFADIFARLYALKPRVLILLLPWIATFVEPRSTRSATSEFAGSLECAAFLAGVGVRLDDTRFDWL